MRRLPWGFSSSGRVIPWLGGHQATIRTIWAFPCANEKESLCHDQGHYIIDCALSQIEDVPRLNHQLNQLPGVVENGLFVDMTERLIIGSLTALPKNIKIDSPPVSTYELENPWRFVLVLADLEELGAWSSERQQTIQILNL